MFGLIKKNKEVKLSGKEWRISNETLLFWTSGIIGEFIPKKQVGNFSIAFAGEVDVKVNPKKFLQLLRQEIQAHSGSISQGSLTEEALKSLREVLVKIEGVCLDLRG